MRRPKKTREQRSYDKQQRLLLTLRRAAVRLCVAEDVDDDNGDAHALALTDLVAAAQRYALSLSRTELRRLVK